MQISHPLVDLNKIIHGAQTGMLTTRASDGHLHSRAMTPASREVQLMYMIIEPPSHKTSHSPERFRTLKCSDRPRLHREQYLTQISGNSKR